MHIGQVPMVGGRKYRLNMDIGCNDDLTFGLELSET